jgi:hypothetical protein
VNSCVPYQLIFLGLFGGTARLEAQSWQPVGVPSNSNSGAYWNNTSDDNVGSAVCNIGAILTNTPALTPASCSNQIPSGLLPLGPRLGTTGVFLGGAGGANPGGFGFAAGTYIVQQLGRVEGISAPWGFVTSTGSVFTAATILAGGGVFSSGTPFAVWIAQSLPLSGAGTLYTSGQSTFSGGSFTTNLNQQFAVFSNRASAIETGAFGSQLRVDGNTEYYIGMEDNVCNGRGFSGCREGPTSDRDYNDVMLRMFVLPEPATSLLVGPGLIALVAIRRRLRARER